jgi:hypothetical protein
MAEQLAQSLSAEGAFGAVELTHEEWDFTARADSVSSRRRLGVVHGGVFVVFDQATEELVIDGADFAALAASGSADGRFWPEDVRAKHAEILAREA